MITMHSSLASAADGEIVLEKLPYPLVHYPPRHGTFLAFGSRTHVQAPPALCSCARSPVENLLRLYDKSETSGSHRFALAHFPKAISRPLGSVTPKDLSILFLPGLCHQCNRTAPTLRYCDPLYGDSFVQTYGWYINQAHLRLGVLPQANHYSLEICPTEYRGQVETAQTARQAFQCECARLLEQAFQDKRSDLNTQGHARELPWSATQLLGMMQLRSQASQAHQQLKAQVEAMVRQAWGLPA